MIKVTRAYIHTFHGTSEDERENKGEEENQVDLNLKEGGGKKRTPVSLL